MGQLFVNNLTLTLSEDVVTNQPTLSVVSSTGLPTFQVGDWLYLTLTDIREGGELRWEIVKVTSWTGTTLTVVRGQDGTAAQVWLAGAKASLRVTAADMAELEAAATPAQLLEKIKTVDGSGSGLDADLLDGLHAASTNTASTVVSRDTSGNFAAGTITATLSGNSSTATKLQTARTINGVSFDGSANITINAVDSTARVASSLLGVANGVATLDATGKVPSTQLPSYVDDVVEAANLASFPATGEIGKIYVALDTNKAYRWSGSAYVYITSGAVDSVAGKTGVVTLVKGDVGLGSVDNTSDATKNVLSATKLTTARTIALAGDVTGSASFDGSANISIATTVAANSVALGTDTTGNYVAGVTAGQGITVTGTAGEGWSPTIGLAALDLTLFPTSNFKKSVKVATTANITLSAAQTIDGIALVAGDRVLVKDQTTASQNGIYIVNASTWTRSVAANNSDEIDSAIVAVDQGTVNGGKFFTNTFKTTDVVGTTAMNWFEVATTSSNVASATKLATARTITLAGDQTGSVSFDGSANVTLTTANVPANLLADLKTVDGAGSGLDADLLDGIDSNGFAKAGGNTGALTVGTNDASNLTLETNNTARVTVGTSGNVGIGTSSPTAKLHISGGGIKLSNTVVADTTTLDWYEEGTFTPVVLGDTTAGTGTYTVQVGSYQRVGNRVHFGLHVGISGHTTAGNMLIGGLPFISSTSGFPEAVSLAYVNGLNYPAGSIPYGFVIPNTSSISLHSSKPLAAAVALAMDTTFELMISGTYEV